MKKQISNYIELTKPRITMLVLVTAYLGYYLGLRSQDNHMVDLTSWLQLSYLLIGTWATSASAAVLNQIIERQQDAQMSRTKNRPLVRGDIKFFRLKQLGVAGLVTDGGVRDSKVIKEYGFPVYSSTITPKQGPSEFWPWEVNQSIQCGGVLVRPGDAIVGDDDGVVVVPKSVVHEVIRIAHEREEVEEIIKAQLEIEQCSPGKYYPFNEETWKLVEKHKNRSDN